MAGRLNETAALLRRSAEDNAHAFEAPIAIIRQSIDTLRRPVGPERAIAAQDAIGEAARTLEDLVWSAQRLEIATADLFDTGRHPVDLAALVERFAAEYRPAPGEPADRLIVEIVPGLRVQGRDRTLRTILEILIDNARRFSPPGGRIFVTLGADRGSATLSVADEGPDVPPDRLESLFTRHCPKPAADPSPREDAGPHGWGLWLVRQSALAMGGDVAAANRPDGGLVVTVTLPGVDPAPGVVDPGPPIDSGATEPPLRATRL
jgi:two-component system sensor histidine kinase ChvG